MASKPENSSNHSRRGFIKGTAMATSALALTGWTSAAHEESKKAEINRADESARHLAYFDPADGAVPNPGMGVNAYVFTDHMHVGYTGTEWNRTQGLPPMPLDRKIFGQMLELPFVDNLYLRFEWKDVQKKQGKLDLPDAWKWVLEAAEKKNKRWSFRIMNCSPHSMAENGLPEFLQGKLKMIPYWHGDNVPGPRPKFFPEYSNDYLNWWAELLSVLGETFDSHPLLEYADISGYGFWGEMHHWAHYSADGPMLNYQPGSTSQVEKIIERLIRDHLNAFPKTPAALGLHTADYISGQEAFSKGLVWPRRDSFMTNFSTSEVQLSQGLQPGSAMLWETILPGVSCLADDQKPGKIAEALPQRYFDIAANYIAMGFNPWDTIWAHEHCLETYKLIESRIGYRIRSSIVWQRRIKDGADELALGLRNDGCSAPPGTISIHAQNPDGTHNSIDLPVGEPSPGAMKIYALPFPNLTNPNDPEKQISLSMSIQIKGKSFPVQWAVNNDQTDDSFNLKIPVKRL